MSDQIVAFKLSTGEEIIGRKGLESELQIVLEKPRVVAMVPGKVPGEIGIQLVPFMASNQDGDIAIFLTQVVAVTTPNEGLEKGYIQNTTGIQI